MTTVDPPRKARWTDWAGLSVVGLATLMMSLSDIAWVEAPKACLDVSSETAEMKSPLTTSPQVSLMCVTF